MASTLVFLLFLLYVFGFLFFNGVFLMVVYLSLILHCALSVMTYYYFCVVCCYFEIIIIIIIYCNYI